jgi:polyisoprenoid-binding protein YceI
MRTFSATSALAILLFAGSTVGAGGTWRVEQGGVRAICHMTVGGSFDAKTTAMTGTVTANGGGSTALDGSLSVDLRTLDTGFALRNEHMRQQYLEVDKGPGYETATVSAIGLKGLNADQPAGKGSFTGSLTLHGVTKTVTGAVDVRPQGGGLRVKATFPVNLSDYSIPEPRYLGVGVRNIVDVEVDFAVARWAPV